MITKNDIISLSKLHGLRPWQEEKRYMQVLILNSLFNYPLILKGGTYLWLFHGLRRFSEDLDFTANDKINDNVSNTVHQNLSLIGINNELKILKNNNVTLSFRILSNGPLYTGVLDRIPVYIEIIFIISLISGNSSITIFLSVFLKKSFCLSISLTKYSLSNIIS